MNSNKEVLNYCPNFYKIVNFNYDESDTITEKLISIYREYIFKIDLKNEEDVLLVSKIDRVLGSYLDDYSFRDQLQKEIVNVKISRDTKDILKYFIETIVNIFNNYQEFTTRVIYISRWI